MSEPPPPQPPLDNARRYRIANEIIQSILDDRPATATVSPSGELYRAVERFHRNVDRVRQGLATARSPEGDSMSSGSERDLRRRFTRSPQTSSGALDDSRSVQLPSIANTITYPPPPLPPSSLPPLRSLGSRRPLGSDSPRDRSHWAELRMERYRRLMADNRNTTTGSSGTDNLERLQDANSHLRTLLDFTDTSPIMPTMPPRDMSPPSRSVDYNDEGRRAKRRRLDSDKTGRGYRGFRYGKYGQSEPGTLTMELVSCDGGMFSNQHEYAAENILKDDASVYCTKGDRCNIVLRHQGSTVFDISELVIKAPGDNYSSPVREGMVFVGMETDEIFNRTAQYQIQYLTDRDVDRLAAERGHRSASRPPVVYSVRHGEDGTTRITRPPLWAQRYENPHTQLDFDGDADGDDDMDLGRSQIAQLPREFTLAPPPFNITSECSSEDADGQSGRFGGLRRSRSYARLQIPNRIGALPFENRDDSDSEEGASDPVAEFTGWVRSNGTRGGFSHFDEVTRGNYDRRRPAFSVPAREDRDSDALQEARDASQLATQEAVRAVGGGLMTPLVHFHIEEHNKCTIRFDPPVSGRFILLKMWSSRTGGNIDIQGVTVKGLAGPRYAPDVEYR